MRKFISFLLFLLLAVVGVEAKSSSSTPSADQQIKACFNSDSFQNIVVKCSYDRRTYDVRIVYNPLQVEVQLKSGKTSPMNFLYGVFTRGNIPEGLQKHISNLVDEVLGPVSGGYWSMGSLYNGVNPFDMYNGARAIEGTALQESPDEECDQLMRDLLLSEKFSKMTIDYPWGEETFSVHLVYNPERAPLFGDGLSKPVNWLFAMTIDSNSYPLAFARHLKSLFPKELLRDSGSVIDVADWSTFFRKNPGKTYTSVHPISVFEHLDDPSIEAQAVKTFSSKKLSSDAMFFHLDDEWYTILLIHNPKGLELKSTLSFDTWESGLLTHTLTWSGTFGIFVNREAPQELIDSLSELAALTGCNRAKNLTVHNGDMVVVDGPSKPNSIFYYEYRPYSWFTFMVDAKP